MEIEIKDRDRIKVTTENGLELVIEEGKEKSSVIVKCENGNLCIHPKCSNVVELGREKKSYDK